MDKEEELNSLVELLGIQSLRHFITEREIENLFLVLEPAMKRTLERAEIKQTGSHSDD